MTITIEGEAEARLQAAAERAGVQPGVYLESLLARTVKPVRFTLSEYRRPTSTPAWVAEMAPANLPEAGKTWADYVIGKWPGDESEEDLLAAAQQIDDEDAGRL